METSIQEQADKGIEVVNARLNYLAAATPKPINYAYDPPAGVPRRSGKYIEQSVVVRNGRKELSKLSLDTNGFVLTEHETAIKDFYDPDEVRSGYYPEVERLLKRVDGARARDRVVPGAEFAIEGRAATQGLPITPLFAEQSVFAALSQPKEVEIYDGPSADHCRLKLRIGQPGCEI